MHYRQIFHVIALMLIFIGAGMLLTTLFVVPFVDSEWQKNMPEFGLCAAVSLGLGIPVYMVTKQSVEELGAKSNIRDGIASVGLSWIIISCFGALPFIFIGHFKFADAFFETVSGLTTTGSSVISSELLLNDGQILTGGIEALSPSLLFWRAFLNWLGGVGIVFFVLLFMPVMTHNRGTLLYNAEVPGMKTEDSQLTPKLSDSIQMITAVYVLITILAISAYRIFGMGFFDAICHAFSTVSTGGFSTRAAGLAPFPNPLLQWSMIFFMFLCACNFNLLLRSISGRKLVFWKDEEFRWFFCCCVLVSLAIFVMMYVQNPVSLKMLDGSQMPRSIEGYLRTAFFHVVSLASTTGFSSSDYEIWGGHRIPILLFIIMFPAGCGGSTSGGVKWSRIVVVCAHIKQEIRHCFSPRTILDVRLNGQHLHGVMVEQTLAFVLTYFGVFILTAMLLVMVEQFDFKTALGSSITCLSNVGPGLGLTGPAFSFGGMCGFSKILCAMVMMTGRLELFTILVLFFPSFWRR